MSAQPLDAARPGVAEIQSGSPTAVLARWASRGAALWPYLAIIMGFWVYVTLSNVLYASNMGTGIAAETGIKLFAPPSQRILQHLILLPALMLCYWGSLRLSWRPLPTHIPLQVLLGAVFSVLGTPALALAEFLCGDKDIMSQHTGGWQHWMSPGTTALWLASATSFLLQYGFGLALVTSFRVYQYYRDSELKIEKIEREWNAARLTALRMQLSPHTLFNLLHAIRGQISWDPRIAQSMIVQLADLLRRLLTAGERDFSRLRDEIHFVRLYLELQQQRFSDRLTVTFPSDEQLANVWVPSLILQPLAENAVVHGLAGHDGAVTIRVEALTDAGDLVLRVTNTIALGQGLGAPGIGLKNVRERLAVHFAGAATFRSSPGSDTEWVAEIRLPPLDQGSGARP